jgi:hypothetical protein
MGGLTRPRPRGCRPPRPVSASLVAPAGTGFHGAAEAHLALEDGDLFDLAADFLLEFGVDRLVDRGDRILAQFLGGEFLLLLGARNLVTEVEFIEQRRVWLLATAEGPFALEPGFGTQVGTLKSGFLGDRRCARLDPGPVAVTAAAAAAAAAAGSFELAGGGAGLPHAAFDLRLGYRLGLEGSLRPAEAGQISAGSEVGFARALAAGHVTRLTRAVVRPRWPLTRGLCF